METKFCIKANDEGLLIDIQGKGTEIMAVLCAAMEKDPTIKDLVSKSLMAMIFHDLIEGKDGTEKAKSDKEMIESLYGSIYNA